MNHLFIRIIIICLCLGIGLPQAAMAGPRIVISPLKVRDESPRKGLHISPTLYVGARTDDNFYKDNEGEERVNSIHIDPGIRIHYEGDKAAGSLWYEMKGRLYDGGNEKKFVGHRLDAKGRYRITPRLNIRARDTATRNRGRNDEDPYDVKQEKYYHNMFNSGADYQISSQFRVKLDYKNVFLRYDEKEKEDWTDNSLRSRFEYRPFNLGWAVLEYRRNWMRSRNDDGDYEADRVFLSSRIRGKHYEASGGFGYHRRYFDTAGRNDADTVVYDLRLSGFTEEKKTRATVRAVRDFGRDGDSRDFSKNTRISAEVRHLFLRRFTVQAGLFYQLSDFEESRYSGTSGKEEWREDDIYGFNAELAYRFEERLQLSLKGGLEKRDSSIEAKDYENRYVMLGMDTYFDWMK